jgi:hypothetical protein
LSAAAHLDPLERAALVELGSEFARLASARADGLLTGRAPNDLGEPERRAITDVLAVGLTWETLAGRFVPPESRAASRFADCLHQRAILLYREAGDALESSAAPSVRIATGLRLFRHGLTLLERTREYLPDDETVAHNADLFRRRIEQLELTQPDGAGSTRAGTAPDPAPEGRSHTDPEPVPPAQRPTATGPVRGSGINPWRRGPLTVNPYYRTAFAVTRVPREVVQRKTVVGVIGQTRKVVRTDPRAHELVGGPVTEPELNAAEQILLDPHRRVIEELLTHAA